jgi:hypothetical protein
VNCDEVEAEIYPEIDKVEDNVDLPAPARNPAGRLSRELKGLKVYKQYPVLTA